MLKLWLVAGAGSLGGLLFGNDWVVIGGAKPLYELYYHLDLPSQQGWAMSCALAGCLMGSLLAGWMTERLGRKRPLVLAAIALYAMSLAPVTWVVIAEIFPRQIRGEAISVATTALWIACFLLTYTFPVLNRGLGSAGTFGLYAGICAVGFVLIRWLLPETKGKRLKAIESDVFNQERSADLKKRTA
jgi:MFS family permease